MKYAIISDIHEDINSLKSVFEKIKKKAVDKIVCLGDITGFSEFHHSHNQSKDANACIDLLKKSCDILVAGNHDLHSVNKLPAYLNRHRQAGSTIPKNMWDYKEEVPAKLSPENIEFLKQLPEYYIETDGKDQILFSHFIYPDLTGSTIAIPEYKKDLKAHFNFMKRKNCLLSFVGHTHIDGFAESDGGYIRFSEFGHKRILNKRKIVFGPGVVKNARRSGYMLFDSKTLELSIVRNEI